MQLPDEAEEAEHCSSALPNLYHCDDVVDAEPTPFLNGALFFYTLCPFKCQIWRLLRHRNLYK